MSKLTVSLLSAPLIEVDGAPIHVDTRKAIALVAYLAVTGRPQSRDVLAALLWEDLDQSGARAALRRTLSALRAAIGPEWLRVANDEIALVDGPGIDIDVIRFRTALTEARALRSAGNPDSESLESLAGAVNLYRDDFLAGFSLRDSPAFENWQVYQAEEMRRELALLLDRLIQVRVGQGDYESAIDAGRRLVAQDPLNESAHQQLMRLYAGAGLRSEALRQYRDCVRVLERELAVAPLPETTELYEAIKENALAVRSQPTVEVLAPLGAAEILPFVGRGAEWSALTDAYRGIRATGRVIGIEGEAGIGKTRLAEEFVRSCARSGAVTLGTRCFEGEGNLAYAPFVELIREAVGQLENTGAIELMPPAVLSEAARLLPQLGALRPDLPVAGPIDNPGAQSRFLEGVSEILFAALEGPVPGVLFIDDLQWADEVSLELLGYVLRRAIGPMHGRRVCIVLTWRREQMAPGSWLRRRLAEAQRSGGAALLSLERLNRDDVRALVRETGGDFGDGLDARLFEETEGLPLFLTEYLAVMRERDSAAWVVPGGVKDLLRSRLDKLSESGRQILGAAAAIGRSFDFDTVREASGRDEDMAVTALEELLAHGLVSEEPVDGQPRYDFTHEKLRALVYEETSLARRRLLHRRIADALVSRTRGRRNAGAVHGVIAYHYRLAGNEVEAARYLVLAGEYARSLYANREAASHFEAALALGHPDEASLHEAIADARTLLGEYGAAVRAYETAASLAEGARLAQVEHKLGNVYLRRGDWDLADGCYESALAILTESEPVAARARLNADRSLVAHHEGKTDCAAELAEMALREADAVRDIPALAQAHNMLGILAKSRGDRAAARRHLEESLALAEELGDIPGRVAALNNLALATGPDNAEEACRLAERALDLCVSVGDRHREAALHNNLADILNRAGDRERAIVHVKQAVTIYADIGYEAGAIQPEIWRLTEW
ncbi:MAG TPA: AAA family ATPase [Chloroflexota bacterium]|nr:AAA family ATPase [Chloroflexota bacterium]